MALPLKTTIADFNALGGFLKTQVGFTPIDKLKTAIDKKHADPRKIDACSFIGFIERDGNNIKLSVAGREYASATDDEARAVALRKCITSVELYVDTLTWMHFTKKTEPTRTEVGNYWHDNQTDKLKGAKNAALTDAVIFFFRLAGASGFGKFVPAGSGRPESYFKCDADALERLATAATKPGGATEGGPDSGGSNQGSDTNLDGGGASDPTTGGQVKNPVVNPIEVNTSPAVHVNIEIHIAADATANTVAEIFKNMRKYVLNSPAETDE